MKHSQASQIAEFGVEVVPVAALRPADSPRVGGLDPNHVQTLAAVDEPLPPLIVHRSTMRIIDGMHRFAAAALRGESHLRVQFFEGPDRDCFALSVKHNATHGLPLSKADRRAAATRIVATYPEWSDRAIAEVVGVSPKTVATLRSSEEVPQLDTRRGMDGRVRSVNIAQRRRAAAEFLARRPDASLREVARAACISVGTARDVALRVRAGKDVVPTGRPSRRAAEASCASPVPSPSHRTGTDDPVPNNLMQRLRSDPSVRLAESGRALIRLLDANATLTRHWAELANSVPAHCVTPVAAVARRCSAAWSRFADELERTASRRSAGQDAELLRAAAVVEGAVPHGRTITGR